MAFAAAVLVPMLLTTAAAPAPLTFETARVMTGDALVVTDGAPAIIAAFAAAAIWEAVPCCWFAAIATGRSTWFSAICAVTAERLCEVVTV